MDKKNINNEIAELVADIVSEIFDSTFPETRVDSIKGGIHRTGSLVIPRTKVNYLKRYKNKDWRKWPKKSKERLNQITNILEGEDYETR